MISKAAFVRTAIPVLIVVVLAATFVLGRRARRPDTGPSIDALAVVRPGDIERIRIEAKFSRPGAEPVVLFRVPGWDGWAARLNGATVPARASRVKDFIERILSTRPQRIVTREPAHHVALYVSRADGDSVVIVDAEETELVHLVFGLPGRDGASLYARLVGEPTVYAVDPALSFFLTRESSYWTDTRVFPSPIDLDRVESLRYGEALALIREYRAGEDVWHDGDARVDTARVHDTLRALFGLQAETVHRASPIVGDTIRVRLDDRSEYIVTYSVVDGTAVAVTVRGPRVYEAGTARTPGTFVYTVSREVFLAAIPAGAR